MIIEDILSCNEGKTLEFKESAQSLSGIVKTIIAFANTAGGTIVIGVEDKNKKIKGVENPLLEEAITRFEEYEALLAKHNLLPVSK